VERLRVFWPYILITISFFFYLLFFHPQVFHYKLPESLIHDYLRSQDIEDPNGLIRDRVFVSDSDIYIASGYLYAVGVPPSHYNFQHPPLIKYLFGFSTILTGNPFYIQIIFGLSLLLLTYFLGMKLFRNVLVSLGAVFLLTLDPVFAGMMNEALLDLGQAFFALGYIVLVFFYPESWVWQGIALGLFASSKFWSTALIFIVLVYGYKLLIQKEKINLKKVLRSFIVAFLIFALTYSASFVTSGGSFNLIEYQGRVLRFMLSHNSASSVGGPIILFITGYFAPWWKAGVERAGDWSLLWPLGLTVSIFGIISEFRKKTKNLKLFFYALPLGYLFLTITQFPFTRYFIIILPFIYLNLTSGANRVRISPWRMKRKLLNFLKRVLEKKLSRL